MKKLFLVLAVIASLSYVNVHAARPVVKPGIEVLRDMDFEGLKGKRVGLVTNPSGVDRYLSPVSGRRATIVLPAFSSLLAS